jgi:hypothetical protein
VHQRQKKETALSFRHLVIKAACDGAARNSTRHAISRECPEVISVDVARELIQHQEERQRMLRRVLPMVEFSA